MAKEGENPVNSARGAGTESGGMADGMSKMNIAMTAVSKGIETAVSVLSKIANMIIESSPMLKGVLGIIDKMFKLVLMPVGNMIARLLLPLTIKMANKTVNLLQKYATAGPEAMADAASEGFSIIIESMIEMMSTILGEVLPPILSGLGSAIVDGIASIFGLGGGEEESATATDYASDLKELMGSAATGTNTVTDQFGYTMITSNKAAGTTSAGTLDTTLQTGGINAGNEITINLKLDKNLKEMISSYSVDAISKTTKMGNAY